LKGGIKVIVEKEKKPEERTCFICHKRKAIFRPDGKHNFVPHIIGGEPETVCLACKMELLLGKRQKNGF